MSVRIERALLILSCSFFFCCVAPLPPLEGLAMTSVLDLGLNEIELFQRTSESIVNQDDFDGDADGSRPARTAHSLGDVTCFLGTTDNSFSLVNRYIDLEQEEFDSYGFLANTTVTEPSEGDRGYDLKFLNAEDDIVACVVIGPQLNVTVNCEVFPYDATVGTISPSLGLNLTLPGPIQTIEGLTVHSTANNAGYSVTFVAYQSDNTSAFFVCNVEPDYVTHTCDGFGGSTRPIRATNGASARFTLEPGAAAELQAGDAVLQVDAEDSTTAEIYIASKRGNLIGPQDVGITIDHGGNVSFTDDATSVTTVETFKSTVYVASNPYLGDGVPDGLPPRLRDATFFTYRSVGTDGEDAVLARIFVCVINPRIEDPNDVGHHECLLAFSGDHNTAPDPEDDADEITSTDPSLVLTPQGVLVLTWKKLVLVDDAVLEVPHGLFLSFALEFGEDFTAFVLYRTGPAFYLDPKPDYPPYSPHPVSLSTPFYNVSAPTNKSVSFIASLSGDLESNDGSMIKPSFGYYYDLEEEPRTRTCDGALDNVVLLGDDDVATVGSLTSALTSSGISQYGSQCADTLGTDPARSYGGEELWFALDLDIGPDQNASDVGLVMRVEDLLSSGRSFVAQVFAHESPDVDDSCSEDTLQYIDCVSFDHTLGNPANLSFNSNTDLTNRTGLLFHVVFQRLDADTVLSDASLSAPSGGGARGGAPSTNISTPIVLGSFFAFGFEIGDPSDGDGNGDGNGDSNDVTGEGDGDSGLGAGAIAGIAIVGAIAICILACVCIIIIVVLLVVMFGGILAGSAGATAVTSTRSGSELMAVGIDSEDSDLFAKKRVSHKKAMIAGHWALDYQDLIIENPPIGQGAFGVVNRGRYKGTRVAIKTLVVDAKEDNYEEFVTEVDNLSKLHHPNIVLLIGASDHPQAIVTEFVARGSLYDIIHADPGILTWQRIRKITRGTARGLAYLHSQKPPMIHRDMKSGNVLVSKNFDAKVCDFGISRRAVSATMTMRAGTTRWTAPEVFSNDGKYTEAADVYSFGVLVWEIVKKELPFDEIVWDYAIEDKVIAGERPIIPDDWPMDLQDLITDCWAHEPEDRPDFVEIVSRAEKLTKKWEEYDAALPVAKGHASTITQASSAPPSSRKRLTGILSRKGGADKDQGRNNDQGKNKGKQKKKKKKKQQQQESSSTSSEEPEESSSTSSEELVESSSSFEDDGDSSSYSS